MRRRLAVVGAGPAGLYGLQAALALPDVDAVDLFDDLPAPYGLVRYGVAADHPKTKTVVRVFQEQLCSSQVRFFGNVRYGRDLHLDDLRRHYDAVVFATGTPGERSLGIPGEDLPGSDSAGQFVSWYSGHPDAPEYRVDGVSSAVVVGAGNVALDVVRILSKDAAELKETDMPDDVLDRLADSSIREVHLLARRGPAYARFSPAELRELNDLDADVVIDPADLELDAASEQVVAESRPAGNVVRILRDLAARPHQGRNRRLHLHFWTRPAEIVGSQAVEGVVLEKAAPDERGEPAGVERTHLPAQLVLRAIGYRAFPLPGLPFEEDRAVVPNDQGRVTDEASGGVMPGLYVTGWLKRGPQGLIGSNRKDAAETIAALAEDLAGLPERPEGDPSAICTVLDSRGVQTVDWPAWERLQSHEAELGKSRGAASVKVADRTDMLRIVSDGPIDS